MSSISLAIVISLALIVHYASAMINAGNPEILPECSHIPMEEGQINSFIGSHGTRCCMCGKGTYLAKECSIQDANSTKCETCKYDSKKKQWHYVDYEPHVESECYEPEAESSCMTPKVLVGGSRFERARCECPSGTVAIDKYTCQSVSNISPKPVPEPLGTEKDDHTHLPTEPPPVATSTTAITQPSLDSRMTSAEATQKRTVSIDVGSKKNFTEVTEGQTSISPDLNSGIYNIIEWTTPNYTTASAKVGTSPIYAIIAIAGSLVSVLVLGIVCLREKGILCTSHRQNQNGVSYVAGQPSESTEKSSDKLLDKDDQVKIEMLAIEEMPQRRNMAETFIARLGDFFQTRHLLTNPADDQRNEADHDPINPGEVDRLDAVEILVNQRPDGISGQEKQLRYDAFMEMAEKIVSKDLSRIGRALLLKQKNAYEDIHENCPNDRAERARKMFIRAEELNPQLRLQDILDLVSDLGYLRDIIEAKMAQMRTDGAVD